MRPRFDADYRALFWALVLFPLVPALGYARPSLVPWLVPISLYLALCSGALAHNHNHCPVFRGRAWNVAYGAWLSVFYGAPLFAWIPTHNQNHHRYVNGPGDETRTDRRSKRNTAWAALTYPFFSGFWQLAALRRYVLEARTRPRRRRRVVAEVSVLFGAHALMLALAIQLHGPGLGAAVYVVSMALPALFAPWLTMFVNYLQHVDCVADSPDDHSRNFVSPLWNWLIFENGYHTVHHEQPGLHWSRYRALHAERAQRIAPHLNVATPLHYCVATYLLHRGQNRLVSKQAEAGASRAPA